MVTMAVTLEMMAAGMPARAETMLSNLAVTKGPLMCVFLSSLVLAVVLATETHASAEVIWTNPSTAGFSTLPLNTPTAFAFPGTGGMTMTRTSEVGSGVTLGTETITYAATIGSYTNPAWVVGTRTYFDIDWRASSTTPFAGSTVSYEVLFAGGLATTSQLVLVDFDRSESVIIKAYDLSNNLIPFVSTSVLLSAGQDTSPRFDDIEWASFAGATGRLRNIFQDSESNIIASINSSTSIEKLVFDFDMNPDNDRTGESVVRFSIAAAVPEIDPAGMGSVLALVTGALGLFERRRLKAA